MHSTKEKVQWQGRPVAIRFWGSGGFIAEKQSAPPQRDIILHFKPSFLKNSNWVTVCLPQIL